MPQWYIFAGCAIVLIIFAIAYKVGGSKRPFKSAVCNMLVGPAALFAVSMTGPFTGVGISMSLLSLSVATVGGIPGVTAMVVLELLL